MLRPTGQLTILKSDDIFLKEQPFKKKVLKSFIFTKNPKEILFKVIPSLQKC
tara:strand:+ start:296 stop:451 length:156 start_codon:yes stop_codon:yes gene_type:complete